jgi:hypothetical protein
LRILEIQTELHDEMLEAGFNGVFTVEPAPSMNRRLAQRELVMTAGPPDRQQHQQRHDGKEHQHARVERQRSASISSTVAHYRVW